MSGQMAPGHWPARETTQGHKAGPLSFAPHNPFWGSPGPAPACGQAGPPITGVNRYRRAEGSLTSAPGMPLAPSTNGKALTGDQQQYPTYQPLAA